MRKVRGFLAPLLVLCLVANFSLSGCSRESLPELKVVTGTTLISAIVAEVGGENVSAVSIVPATIYPADFEPKPEDIKILSGSQLFIIHNWQKDKFTQTVIAGAGNPALVVARIDTSGDWMVPSVQCEATDKIARALMDFDRKNAATYQKRAEEYKERVKKKESMIRARAELAYKSFISRNIPSFNVICAESLSEFIRWLGLGVIGTYGRADSLTETRVADLVAKGKEKKVVIVVDSYQSGKDAGTAVAQGIGVLRAVLSSYPGVFSNTETWEKAIDRNVGLLLGALEAC